MMLFLRSRDRRHLDVEAWYRDTAPNSKSGLNSTHTAIIADPRAVVSICQSLKLPSPLMLQLSILEQV
jgi:hypothetical protein